MTRRYQVVYLWKGERHVSIRAYTHSEAIEIVAEMRADGWQAWEEIL